MKEVMELIKKLKSSREEKERWKIRQEIFRKMEERKRKTEIARELSRNGIEKKDIKVFVPGEVKEKLREVKKHKTLNVVGKNYAKKVLKKLAAFLIVKKNIHVRVTDPLEFEEKVKERDYVEELLDCKFLFFLDYDLLPPYLKTKARAILRKREEKNKKTFLHSHAPLEEHESVFVDVKETNKVFLF